MAKAKTAITPTRAEDYPEWYQQVIRAAEMAEPSPVRGCMVIRPWGYALWEHLRTQLDIMFKATGHVNAYFPLFIPLSYLQKEADHVEGFAKECAVVTHHRLEPDADGKLQPAGPLEEPLVVRPTSETIIGASYAKWVQSYRDLPIMINQWANVVRWEMRTRLFLRTAEFLWQEGHTAHETQQEAWDETLQMLEVYRRFAEDYMAMPVITGEKTEGERFPGAVNTFSIESMMQDRKALQAGTSHFLGQNFAKSSEIIFQSREGEREHAWTTSWGVSTRLIGGMIMTHGDDDGMRMPPRLAPNHIVVLPIFRNDDERDAVMAYCTALTEALRGQTYDGAPVRVELDVRDINNGEKGWQWIKRGIPVRVEVGPRDMKSDSVFVGRRDKGPRDKYGANKDEFVAGIADLLEEMQSNMLSDARAYLKANTQQIDDWESFKAFFTPADAAKPEIHGGFVESGWCGSNDCEAQANRDLAVSIRCIPTEARSQAENCVICGSKAMHQVVYAKAY